MNLAEALSIVHKAPADVLELPVLLACGFTPLRYLQNYLAAHLQKAMPERRVRIHARMYEDLQIDVESQR